MKYLSEFTVVKKIINDLNEKYFSCVDKLDFDIDGKGDNDIVTSIDLAVENYVIEQLNINYPDDNIIAEETKSSVDLKDRNWVIDPIDGTCNFAGKVPFYGFQIALIDKEGPLLSVIFLPAINHLYYAEKGYGAYLNNEKIKVNSNKELNKAIISFGDFSKSYEKSVADQLNIYQILHDKVLRYRMFGAACYDFSFVASGKTHAHIMFSNKIWDIMPGLLLAKEAGAYITNLDGTEFDISKGAFIVTANKELNRSILDAIN